jgi:hypothetical protein
MHVVFRLLCHWSLWSRLPTASAQVPAEPPNESIDWPSPDGKFAFRGSYAEYLHTIDLIDRQSGKQLQSGAVAGSWHRHLQNASSCACYRRS